MTKKIVNLKDLFVFQGREMYNVSKRAMEELPKMKSMATSPEVKSMLEREWTASKVQCETIEKVFSEINESPVGETPEWTNWMFTRTNSIVSNTTDPTVRDTAIVNSVQQMNHNKITGLGSMSSYAKEIGHTQIANTLHQTVEVERGINSDLSRMVTMSSSSTNSPTEPTTV